MSKNQVNINECSVFITKGTVLVGALKTDGDIFLDGKVDGEITAKGKTFVSQDSIINADIYCKDISVKGEINGNLDVANCIEVSSTGRIIGNIDCDELLIDEGAVYRGEISVQSKTKSKMS